ncbi:hypothetical protein SAMN05444000_103243 [Shimia gijangensis]|uniref:Nickel/cobalt transporter regulator n=1 Tax=Shimia gijangensis TaxID=1470563 RepID=A0A1M6EME8_9RHOB|nr:hypothetical protein [Shimia gijangensis]SHI86586.1 hypothetical protein SAMN05444000_103243 [Shimia gijangensis]
MRSTIVAAIVLATITATAGLADVGGKKKTARQANAHHSKVEKSHPYANKKVLHTKRLTRVQKRRLPALPRGHSYRVVGDHVVAMDEDLLVIVSVLGLASVLFD